MRLFTTRPRRRAALGIAALAAVVALGGPLAAVTPAHAALACRSDPVVTLSDGIKLNLSASLADDTSADIKAITYTLHVPAGVGVTKIVYTTGAVGTRERVTVYADDAPHQYNVTTDVDTYSSGVSVTATTNAVYQGAGSGGTAWDSATGHDNQAIATQISQ